LSKLYKQLFKRSIQSVIVLLTILFITGLGTIAYNNRNTEPPGENELSESLEASIVWLVENKESMLDFDNSILWYFLYRSAQVSGDPRIQSLVDSYYTKYIEIDHYANSSPNSIWKGMFKPGFNYGPLPFDVINGMNYYSQHFAYAIYCDEELGQLDNIKAQNESGFCGAFYLIHPTCTTHQLMGIRFLQRSDCGDRTQLASTVAALQSKIERELTYDPRVLDVYIQRVMMLVESGNYENVKNIWIRRILEHQHSDGGWGNFQPLISLDDEPPLYLGFGYGQSQTGKPRAGPTFLRIFGIGQPRSTFHATAQGVLLLTLLVHNNY